MVVIAGGSGAAHADVGGDVVANAVPLWLPAEPGSSEARVVAALIDCVARWGLQKTTIEDLARASGLSRATVYRLFPGGKQAIVDAAAATELARLADSVGHEVAGAASLEDALTAAISTAMSFLSTHDAFEYLREHEPEVLESFVAYDRLDDLLGVCGTLLSPTLSRFLPPADATEVGVWAARVVVSYLNSPAPGLDPAAPGDARRLVVTYLLPGLPAAPVEPAAG
jgi:AcrR family transcriptional regulator